jgi:methyl-accepting chemotaxis protein
VATALLISLAIVVPKVFRFIGQLEETVMEVDNLLVDVKSITKDVNGLADNVNSLVDNTNNMVTDNMGAITEIVQSLNEIDFDTLNKAITDLSDVVEPLGNMVRYFR